MFEISYRMFIAFINKDLYLFQFIITSKFNTNKGFKFRFKQ
jgi:hypothetical protein